MALLFALRGPLRKLLSSPATGEDKEPAPDWIRGGGAHHFNFKRSTPILTFPRRRLCRTAQTPHICHPERNEGSRVFSHIRRRDFSASPRNDSCDTVCRGGRNSEQRSLPGRLS